MNTANVDFVTYCIGNLSRRLGISSYEVYQRLKSSGILTDYIIPCYDVLHTFSKEYLLELSSIAKLSSKLYTSGYLFIYFPF